jgi:MoaA/NifB/PqqE/SkfB family radical SAM enzyme
MSYITIDNLNSINAELSNYCNAACPMCARYDWNLDLVEGKVNNSYTKLRVFEEKIGKKVIGQLRRFYSCGTYGDGATNPECLEIYEFLRKHNQTANLSL